MTKHLLKLTEEVFREPATCSSGAYSKLQLYESNFTQILDMIIEKYEKDHEMDSEESFERASDFNSESSEEEGVTPAHMRQPSSPMKTAKLLFRTNSYRARKAQMFK